MPRRSLRYATALAACLSLGGPALLLAQPPPIGDPNDLTQVVSVDQGVYPVGAPVQVTRSTCNETPDAIQFNVSGTNAPYLEILDLSGAVIAFAQPDGHGASIVPILYEPGQCRIGVYQWFQSAGRFDHLDDPLGPQVPEGVYRVRVPSSFPGGDPVVSAAFVIGEAAVAAPALGAAGLLLLGVGLALAAVFVLRR